jgi:hypothetical protein
VAAPHRRAQAHSSALGGAISDLVTKRKLDRAMLDGDRGRADPRRSRPRGRGRIAAALGEGRHDKAISADEVKAVVAAEVEKALAPVAQPLVIDAAQKAVRHPGGRRQRFRQDHDHRQARGQIARRRPQR